MIRSYMPLVDWLRKERIERKVRRKSNLCNRQLDKMRRK